MHQFPIMSYSVQQPVQSLNRMNAQTMNPTFSVPQYKSASSAGPDWSRLGGHQGTQALASSLYSQSQHGNLGFSGGNEDYMEQDTSQQISTDFSHPFPNREIGVNERTGYVSRSPSMRYTRAESVDTDAGEGINLYSANMRHESFFGGRDSSVETLPGSGFNQVLPVAEPPSSSRQAGAKNYLPKAPARTVAQTKPLDTKTPAASKNDPAPIRRRSNAFSITSSRASDSESKST